LRGGPVLRWGVLAPGTIAGDFVATVRRNTDQKVAAVASRSIERGRRFAERDGIERVHESYEALVPIRGSTSSTSPPRTASTHGSGCSRSPPASTC
jgi:hypothetical protein